MDLQFDVDKFLDSLDGQVSTDVSIVQSILYNSDRFDYVLFVSIKVIQQITT